MQQNGSRLYWHVLNRTAEFSWQQMLLALFLVVYSLWFGGFFLVHAATINVNEGISFLPTGLVAGLAIAGLVRLYTDRRPVIRLHPAFVALTFVVEVIVFIGLHVTTRVFYGPFAVEFSWMVNIAAIVAELLLLWTVAHFLDVRKQPRHHPAVAP